MYQLSSHTLTKEQEEELLKKKKRQKRVLTAEELERLNERKAICKKTGFGCSRCRWCPSGCLVCNEAKMERYLAKKRAKEEAN